MNVRKNSMVVNPAKKVKGSGSAPSGNNTAKPIKNAVAVQPGTPSTKVGNAGSCQGDY